MLINWLNIQIYKVQMQKQYLMKQKVQNAWDFLVDVPRNFMVQEINLFTDIINNIYIKLLVLY